MYPLARELGRLSEKYNQLDLAEGIDRREGGNLDNTRAKMILLDRMQAIYEEASYLQSDSIVGAAFQIMIVNSRLDVLTDLDGNDQRALQAQIARLLYQAARCLVTPDDIRVAQSYLMSEYLSPFALLREVANT